MSKKPPWSQVTLRWYGDVPEFGVVMETSTGRRYQVIGIKGRAVQCLVLPPDAPIDGPVMEMYWVKRQKRTK